MNDRPKPSSIGLIDILSGRPSPEDQRVYQEAILQRNIFLFGEGPDGTEAWREAEQVLFGHHAERLPALLAEDNPAPP